jgi:hypothetical protein
MCGHLDAVEPSGETDLAAGAETTLQAAGLRGLVLFFSDFLGESDRALALLGQMVARGHEVMAVQVHDPAEIEFPFRGLASFRSMESEECVLAEPRAIRDAYARLFARFLERTRHACVERGLSHRLLRTDMQADQALLLLLSGPDAWREGLLRPAATGFPGP